MLLPMMMMVMMMMIEMMLRLKKIVGMTMMMLKRMAVMMMTLEELLTSSLLRVKCAYESYSYFVCDSISDFALLAVCGFRQSSSTEPRFYRTTFRPLPAWAFPIVVYMFSCWCYSGFMLFGVAFI